MASLAAAFHATGGAFAAYASERIRVGLIGCGGRGTDAALNCAAASPDVVITAMGDLFPDMLDASKAELKKKLPADRVLVTPETSFSGFDAFKKVCATDCDLVILATPPFFRPTHLAAAIEAGKHVFTEKPVAVDPQGIRSVIATAELAAKKGRALVAGTQRRHQAHYVEIMNRVRSGDIGEIVSGQAYWNMGGLWLERAAENWKNRKDKNWSDMEWQVRNWLFTSWASGDHIVEQHVHNLDVMNWAFGSHPVKCVGMGGRAARTDPMFGNIYDHFAVEYQYPNGARVLSFCRQTEGAAENVSERVVGTKGDDLHRQHRRIHQGRQAVQDRPGVAEPVRAGARGPDRQHPRRQAAQRGTPGRGEHAHRDHGPHERVHRPGAQLGLGDELVEAGSDAARDGAHDACRSSKWRCPARPRSSRPLDITRGRGAAPGGGGPFFVRLVSGGARAERRRRRGEAMTTMKTTALASPVTPK